METLLIPGQACVLNDGGFGDSHRMKTRRLLLPQLAYVSWVEEQLKLQQELHETRLSEALEGICKKLLDLERGIKKQAKWQESHQEEFERLKKDQEKMFAEVRQEQGKLSEKQTECLKMQLQLRSFEKQFRASSDKLEKQQEELTRASKEQNEKIAKFPNLRTLAEHLTKCQPYHDKIDRQSQEIETLKQALEASKSDLQAWKKDHQDDIRRLVEDVQKQAQASPHQSKYVNMRCSSPEQVDASFQEQEKRDNLKDPSSKESGQKQVQQPDDATPVPFNPLKQTTEAWLQTPDVQTKTTNGDQQHRQSAGEVQERVLDVKVFDVSLMQSQRNKGPAS